jgi:hypothetical protein
MNRTSASATFRLACGSMVRFFFVYRFSPAWRKMIDGIMMLVIPI